SGPQRTGHTDFPYPALRAPSSHRFKLASSSSTCAKDHREYRVSDQDSQSTTLADRPLCAKTSDASDPASTSPFSQTRARCADEIEIGQQGANDLTRRNWNRHRLFRHHH